MIENVCSQRLHKQNNLIFHYIYQHFLFYFMSSILSCIHVLHYRYIYFLVGRESKDIGLQSYLCGLCILLMGSPAFRVYTDQALDSSYSDINEHSCSVLGGYKCDTSVCFSYSCLQWLQLTDDIRTVVSSDDYSAMLYSLLRDSGD